MSLKSFTNLHVKVRCKFSPFGFFLRLKLPRSFAPPSVCVVRGAGAAPGALSAFFSSWGLRLPFPAPGVGKEFALRA